MSENEERYEATPIGERRPETEDSDIDMSGTEHDVEYDPDAFGAHAGQQESIVKPNEELLYVAFDHKATIDMGGTSCFLNKRVNWFHRWMIRLTFGWKVTNVE